MTSQSSQMESSALQPLNNILDFIYSKPSINHGGETVGIDNEDSSSMYPSIFEMLSDLQKVKESLRKSLQLMLIEQAFVAICSD